jgi:hypothetical protein
MKNYLKSLQEIISKHPPEVRIKLLREMHNIIKKANKELGDAYIVVKDDLNKQKYDNVKAEIDSK